MIEVPPELGGPELPRPTKTILETEAAVSGVACASTSADRRPLPERLAELLEIEVTEAAARYVAWLDWEAHCWQVFENWATDRGFTPLGFTWDGERRPTFYVEGTTRQ